MASTIRTPQRRELAEAAQRSDQLVALEVQLLQLRELATALRQSGQLVANEAPLPQRRDPVDALRQSDQLVAREVQPLQRRELADALGRAISWLPSRSSFCGSGMSLPAITASVVGVLLELLRLELGGRLLPVLQELCGGRQGLDRATCAVALRDGLHGSAAAASGLARAEGPLDAAAAAAAVAGAGSFEDGRAARATGAASLAGLHSVLLEAVAVDAQSLRREHAHGALHARHTVARRPDARLLHQARHQAARQLDARALARLEGPRRARAARVRAAVVVRQREALRAGRCRRRGPAPGRAVCSWHPRATGSLRPPGLAHEPLDRRADLRRPVGARGVRCSVPRRGGLPEARCQGRLAVVAEPSDAVPNMHPSDWQLRQHRPHGPEHLLDHQDGAFARRPGRGGTHPGTGVRTAGVQGPPLEKPQLSAGSRGPRDPQGHGQPRLVAITGTLALAARHRGATAKPAPTKPRERRPAPRSRRPAAQQRAHQRAHGLRDPRDAAATPQHRSGPSTRSPTALAAPPSPRSPTADSPRRARPAAPAAPSSRRASTEGLHQEETAPGSDRMA